MRLVLALWLSLAFAMPGVAAEELEIIVWANATANERYRTEGIALAATILNEELKVEGRDTRVRITQQTWRGRSSWEQMKQAFVLAVEAGRGPHIIVAGHEDIPVWGRAGLIRPIEQLVDLDRYPFNDVFDNLWPIMSWNGQIWGVPQDAEARPLFVWIPHLRAIGWTSEQIQSLPERIERGEYSLQNMLRDARKMQDAGVVKPGHGFYPRPRKTPDFWQFYKSFGGEFFDARRGRLLLDVEALRAFYQFFHDAVFVHEVTRKNHIGMSQERWYAEVASGQAGFWQGGTWHYARYTRGEALRDFFDKVAFALIPAGRPGGQAVTLTHPLAYLVSRRASGETAYICARLIAIVTEPRMNTLHAIASAHLGITHAQTQLEMYASDRWTAETTALLERAFALPNIPAFGRYDRVVWQGLLATWSGSATPGQAVETVVRELQATMSDTVIIK